MDTNITIKDIKGLVRRRAKLFILVFAIIFLAMAILALSLPPMYLSKAVILIETQQIPDEYVKSTITSYAEQRLEMISREILRGEILRPIIDELDLYPKVRKSDGIGSAIQEMKDAILVEPISSKIGVKSYTVAFNLSYEGEDPEKVFQVTDRLSKLYLQKETEKREKQASVTTQFMEAELENLKKQIEQHEEKISEFKKQHIGELPGSVNANISTLQRLENELDRTSSRIRTLQDRKIYLKGQLANIDPLKPIQTQDGKVASNPQERLKTLRLELIRLSSRLSNKHPDVIKLVNEIEKLENQVGTTDEAVVKIKRLQALRTELSTMESVKGEKHPDIQRLKSEIGRLSNEVDKLLTDRAVVNVSEQKPDNPFYIDLATQIASADFEIGNLNEDTLKLNELIVDYQQRIENAPTVEREFNELTIDYNNAKQRYNEVLTKLLQARVAQEMEIQQQGERFSITDPAYVPTKPHKPNRFALILLGFVLASGGGLVTATLKESLDHTIKSGNDFASFEGVDLLTVMPYTPTDEELRIKKVRLAAMVVGCFMILGIVLIAVDRLILPLNEAIAIVIERLTY